MSAPPPHVPAARSNMRGTLLSFAAVLGLALPVFIVSKRRNDAAKRERHIATRGGAMAQMNEGVKFTPSSS
ncbi:hypothetical protein BCR35DRAFT_306386 [Leucosporidium creatinivorum]|uniref:Uncharacterized protein n=1 Tax=Leucosporidium creatinivorum TaxID=106004 RepID=A0A1Y2ETU2_9BASI|nr:hypothetical protein BCR35DRAFT_306386 [Leucosporidium creatinivorum]